MRVHKEAEKMETTEDPFKFSSGSGTLRIKKEQIPWGKLENPYPLRGKIFWKATRDDPGLSVKSISRYVFIVVGSLFCLVGVGLGIRGEVFPSLLFSCLHPAWNYQGLSVSGWSRTMLSQLCLGAREGTVSEGCWVSSSRKYGWAAFPVLENISVAFLLISPSGQRQGAWP